MKALHSTPLAVFLLALSASACVEYPYDGFYIDNEGDRLRFYFATDDVPIRGWANAPDTPLIVQVYDVSRDQWRDLAYARSSTGSVNFGGETLYRFETTFNLSESAYGHATEFGCYFDETCSRLKGYARLRVRQPDASPYSLFTFSQGGYQCTFQEVVSEGKDLADAYYECAPPENSGEFRMYFF